MRGSGPGIPHWGWGCWGVTGGGDTNGGRAGMPRRWGWGRWGEAAGGAPSRDGWVPRRRGGQARGCSPAPPPPAGLRSRSRDVTAAGSARRGGAGGCGGAEAALYESGAPPGAQSRSPRPGAPRPAWPRPAPSSRSRPLGRLGGEGPSARRRAAAGA